MPLLKNIESLNLLYVTFARMDEDMGLVIMINRAKTISLNVQDGSKQATPSITKSEPKVEAFVAACILERVSGILNKPRPLSKSSKTPRKLKI